MEQQDVQCTKGDWDSASSSSSYVPATGGATGHKTSSRQARLGSCDDQERNAHLMMDQNCVGVLLSPLGFLEGGSSIFQPKNYLSQKCCSQAGFLLLMLEEGGSSISPDNANRG